MKLNEKASNASASKATISRRVLMLQQTCDLFSKTGELSEEGFDCDVTAIKDMFVQKGTKECLC
jgi:hypothetical protein